MSLFEKDHPIWQFDHPVWKLAQTLVSGLLLYIGVTHALGGGHEPGVDLADGAGLGGAALAARLLFGLVKK